MNIAIDINTLRNLNKQINICYEKETGKPFVDNEELIKHDLKREIKFDSVQARSKFYFENYPFEIFGCAPCMTNECPLDFEQWVEESENFDKDTINIMLVSPFESGLSIKATMFFLSKWFPCREMYFPKQSTQIWDRCDVLVTSDEKLSKNKPDGKVLILIENGTNKDSEQYADLSYETIDNMISDNFDFNKLYKKIK